MNVLDAKRKFRGSMVSVATPFTADYELDLGLLRENIRFMVDRGYTTGQGVLLVAAAGGEFPMLTMEERKRVIKASVEAANGQVPVAASIQFNGTRETVDLARYAREVGADLGQLSSPYYYEPTNADIIAHFSAAAETGLPIMIYANWWNTRAMDVDMAERLADLPNIVALKWSAPHTAGFTEGLHRLSEKIAVIDNHGLPVWSHMLGAVGIITHIGNFWPAYAISIWNLLEARQYEEAIRKLAQFKWGWSKWVGKVVAETEGEGPFIKAAMEAVGLRAGPPRLPAHPVGEPLRAELRQLMAQAGVPRAEDQ